jgi:hypothetical protein
VLTPRAQTDRWVDLATGLPIQWVSGVPDVAGTRFVAEYNAEIKRAKEAGEIHVDLRPFLTTRETVARLFRTGVTQTIAPKRPLDLLGGAVRYEVFVPRPPRTPPRFRPAQTSYLRRIDELGRHFVLPYDDGPLPFVLGPGEQTVVFETPNVRVVFHVVTGATLHQFPR